MECFDRRAETDELWRLVEAERNVLMLAPRRIGKTVVLHRLSETSAVHQRRAIVLDVEGAREPKDFFRGLCSVIQEQLDVGTRVMTAFSERLKRALGGADVADWRQMLATTNGSDFAEHLVGHLNEPGPDHPWVILVDELPIFVQALLNVGGPSAASAFLYELRRLRQKYRRVRWVYTGSIGLDAVARRHGMEGALNDLDLYHLPPFAPETAAAFLAHIAEGRGTTVEDAAVHEILSRLDWLAPYYLLRIGEDACSRAHRGAPVDVTAARAALANLLSVEKRLYWSSWREHLDRNFAEPHRSRLYVVLQELALAPGPVTRNAVIGALNRGAEPVSALETAELVHTLLADGFVAEKDGALRFQMPLLREWWRRYVIGL